MYEGESQRPSRARKLRPLVISIPPAEDDDGHQRQPCRRDQITRMFATHPGLRSRFEPPAFSPGVPSRSIRTRSGLIERANEAGLIPDSEWMAIQRALRENETAPATATPGELDPFRYLDDSILISPHRKGSDADVKLHYCVEFWRKAKSLNRDRSVLACTLAHLIAMKTAVEEEYDLILEDNVRAVIGEGGEEDAYSEEGDGGGEECDRDCECARRIWNTIDASKAWEERLSSSEDGGKECHLRYYGWLGSMPNISWIYEKHIPRATAAFRDSDDGNDERLTSSDFCIFPIPVKEDFALDSIPSEGSTGEEPRGAVTEAASGHDEAEVANDAPNPLEATAPESDSFGFTAPGGTPVWGAFAYRISPIGYAAILESLRHDVGSLMWKGKRMRCYIAKPIDKIMPRKIVEAYGREAVHVSAEVAFVRAPMLGSLLHGKWEDGFCRSTERQFRMSSSMSRGVGDSAGDGNAGIIEKRGQDKNCSNGDAEVWDRVWLTEEERRVVAHRKATGKWARFDEITKTENYTEEKGCHPR